MPLPKVVDSAVDKVDKAMHDGVPTRVCKIVHYLLQIYRFIEASRGFANAHTREV
jgi:hypothetical protein